MPHPCYSRSVIPHPSILIPNQKSPSTIAAEEDIPKTDYILHSASCAGEHHIMETISNIGKGRMESSGIVQEMLKVGYSD